MTNAAAQPSPSLRALAAVSLKIGALGFGGPAGQIALMHKIFVDEKKWIDEDHYLYALSYCSILPGPEAQQLATYAGWMLHGVRGGLIAGTLFVLPGAAIMLGLSWLYVVTSQLPLVDGALFGLRGVVLALIIQSTVKIGAKALKPTWTKAVAIVSFFALVFAKAGFPLVIIAAALVGLAIGLCGSKLGEVHKNLSHVAPNVTSSLKAALVWTCLWLLPLGLLIAVPQSSPVLREIGTLFSGLSLITFGGAYAATAWLNQQAVEIYGWLNVAQMIDGLALVQAIPGPLVLVNQYVGFVAGWKTGGPPLAIAGGLLASWCTFAPSFVWIFAGAPFAERLRHNILVATALKAVNAAVVGVIASLAFWFGLQLLFGEGARVTPWPDWRQFDFAGASIVLIGLVLLARAKLALPFLLALGMTAGMTIRYLL